MSSEGRMTVKDMIKKALLELMAEKPYMEITVTDIIKKAEVARVSYYRNYNSIDEILEEIVEDKVEDFHMRVKPLIAYGSNRDKWTVFLRTILESKLSMRDRLNMTKEANKQFIFDKMDTKIQEKFLELGHEAAKEKYKLSAKMGIIHSVSNIWLKTGAKESPDEMVEIILDLVMKL